MALEVEKPVIVTGDEGLIATLIPQEKEETPRVMYDIAPSAIGKVILTLAALWFLIRVFPVLILIFFSLMLVSAFTPLVRRFQARLGRSWAIVAVVTAMISVFLGLLALSIPPMLYQGYNLILNAPKYAQKIQHTLAQHHIRVNVEQQVEQIVNVSNATPRLMSLLIGTLNGATAFATVAILTIYLLIEGPQVGAALLRLLPKKDRRGVRKLAMQIGLEVGGYVRGQLITSGLAGLFACILLLVLRAPGVLALGALTAIADAVPIVGMLIAVVPATLIALTVSTQKAEIVFFAYIVYSQLESHWIGPRIYGQALGLRLSVVVISILIGVELMGMLGAILALPIAAAVPSIIAYIQEWQERNSPSDPSPLP